MSTESGLISELDNIEEPTPPDCCSSCGRLISSARQIDRPGTSICDACANVDLNEEER